MVLDYADIRRILPHGPPMVLVDRVLSIEPGSSIVAVKAITGTELCFESLPAASSVGRYAYPTSLLLESFGQVAAILWVASFSDRQLGTERAILLAGMRNCHLEGRAFPGDVLRHVVALDHPVGDTIFVRGETWVADRRILNVESMMAAVRSRSHLTSQFGGPHAGHEEYGSQRRRTA